MKVGKKQIGCLLGLFIIMIIILTIFLFLKNDYPDDEKIAMSSERVSVDLAPWDELAIRQQDNGSWDDDLETTMIASNALTQGIELMDSDGDGIDWQTDKASLNQSKNEKSEAVKEAQEWSVNNYGIDAQISTQNNVNYFFGIMLRQDIIDYSNMTSLAAQSNEVVISSQSNNGSWDDNVQQTGFSTYVLKKSQEPNTEAIKAGEDWLISKEKNGNWGSTTNDTFALLGLHNTSYDMSEVIDRLIKSQDSNGSFKDLETTAWAVIALSLYDDLDARKAANNAREWLLEQQGLSDRELALKALAESEFISSEINRIEGVQEYKVIQEKGPPAILLIFFGVVCSVIVILCILYLRLGECDALDGARKGIYNFIKEHPGLNQNALMRQMDLSSSSIRHHLKVLERYDYILAHNDGKYVRYYINKNGYSIYTNGNGYKEIISVLRKNTAANIVSHILKNPNSTQKHLAEALNLHPSTVHWHTKLLLSSKIISAKRSGKSVQYQINGPLDIGRLLTLAN